MFSLSLSNFDLFSVGITLAASIFLGFIVYLNNRHSITNQIFLLFTFISSAWGFFNYLIYQLSDPQLSLYSIRIVMFLAVWQAFSFFVLSHTFPKDRIEFSRSFIILFFLVSAVAVIALTPMLFSNIISAEGIVPKATPGPGLIAFGLTAVGLVIAGISQLVINRRKTTGLERKQFNFLLMGVGLMFVLIVTFNFLLPVILDNRTFIPLGAVFVFPFLFATSYAILKHKLLHVKIIATEIIAFLLVIMLFVEVLLSTTAPEIIFRSFLLILLVFVSLLLIRSVRQEVQQREQLQILTHQLAEANEKLKVLDKARAEFISIASHQLRTPPATIKWYLAAVLAGDFGKVSQRVSDAVKKAEITNNTLISLIDDLLNVSRIERGKMEFLFEETDMLKLVQTATDQLIPQAMNKKLKLVFSKPRVKIPVIMSDKEKLQQVVNNLIDNAIKYSKRGTITVKLSRQDDNVLIKVQDMGKGMALEEMAGIFQKYGRGKDSIQHAAGLGLGLYVAKVVVEHHHGKIWAESKGAGKGSSFNVLLPIHTNLADEAELDLTK